MLYFTRWKALAIILTALVVCLCAVPNFFPEAKVKTWPSWAQRHIVLGLDLQGGSHLLLEVDGREVRQSKMRQLLDDSRTSMRDLRRAQTIRANATVVQRGDIIEVRTDPADTQAAITKLRELATPLGGFLGTTGQM